MENTLDFTEFRKTSSSNDELKNEGKNDRLNATETPVCNLLQILPDIFEKLVGRPIKIENEDPQIIIDLLGDLLEIKDYKVNLASFWFLDTIALQLYRNKDVLDDYGRSVLVSWLAGEMKLIQDKMFCRNDFFKTMKKIYKCAIKHLSQNKPLYWNFVLKKCSDENFEVEVSGEFSDIGYEENEIGNLKSTMSLQNELQRINAEQTNNMIIGQQKIMKDPESVTEPTNSMSSFTVLNVIIDATYDMYANELRYALVYNVFVESIDTETYYLPFIMRTSRPVKLEDSETFRLQMQKRLEENNAVENLPINEKHVEKERVSGKGRHQKKNKESNNKKVDIDIPATPPPSLADDDVLANIRQFLQSLVESNEKDHGVRTK